ncbi:hypothetical protein QQF64_019021 [Cirrhinus molitorella]|uniref:Uncharacterized protein n=1 Tax=Cirrhinus molitorella TaxID=172907 RepID=A0ABR3LED2_9TELE
MATAGLCASKFGGRENFSCGVFVDCSERCNRPGAGRQLCYYEDMLICEGSNSSGTHYPERWSERAAMSVELRKWKAFSLRYIHQ